MAWGTPLAFALAALALPIVLLYILKVRLRRIPVSTNLFWKQIYDEKPPRSIWQHLRHLLSLLAQLLLLLLLVAAVADPYFPWQLLQARRIVAVIDNSASMRAADIQPNRFTAAVQAAIDTAEGLRFRDQMAIVLASPQPEVVVGMSDHVPTLRRALQSLQVSDNPTQLQPAIELGRRLIGQHPHGQVLVYSDGCSERAKPDAESEDGGAGDENTGESSASPPTPSDSTIPPEDPGPSVQFHHFGTPEAGNVGITQFQVRRSLIDPLGYEVLLRVRNASHHHIQGRLELLLENVPVDILPLDLKPEEVFQRTLEKTSLEGGTLVANLTELRPRAAALDAVPDAGLATEPSDEPQARLVNALATDDQAWAIVPPREVQQVLLVTPGNLFLQKVFEANPLARVRIEKEFPQTWPSDAIIVLHGAVPDPLPAGNVFVVDPSTGCDMWQLGPSLENPIVTEQDKNSPLMTHVRLDNVLMPAARQLTFPEPPHVLAGTVSGDPVYAEVKRTRGRCLVLSVDINEGDLAFRTAFPIMVANAMGWFAGRSGELRPSLSTGAMTVVDGTSASADRARQYELLSPSGTRHALEASELGTGALSEQQVRLTIPPLAECGIWSVFAKDQFRENTKKDRPTALPTAQLAVNLASPEETDVRTPADRITQSQQTQLAGWFTRPIWYYLAASALGLMVVEWCLYQRRVIT